MAILVLLRTATKFGGPTVFLVFIQPAAVRATNETAQLEKGGNGKVRTINSRVRSELRHVSGIPIGTHVLLHNLLAAKI